MDEAHLDPNAILASLGFERPGSIERVSGGRDTAIFRVELGGELHALRVFRPGEDVVARREAQVMRAAGEGGVPVPRVCAEGTGRDRAALLLSWCPGRSMAGGHPWQALTGGAAGGEGVDRLGGAGRGAARGSTPGDGPARGLTGSP